MCFAAWSLSSLQIQKVLDKKDPDEEARKQAVKFYTETKTITCRWFSSDAVAETNFSIRMR